MCPDFADLSAYLDDELSNLQRKDLEKHLATCPSCSKEYRRLQELHQMFSTRLETDVQLDVSRERFEQKRHRAELARLSRPNVMQVTQAFLPLAAAAALFVLPSFILKNDVNGEEALALQPLATISAQSVSNAQKSSYEEKFDDTGSYFELILPSQLSLPQLDEDDFSELPSQD